MPYCTCHTWYYVEGFVALLERYTAVLEVYIFVGNYILAGVLFTTANRRPPHAPPLPSPPVGTAAAAVAVFRSYEKEIADFRANPAAYAEESSSDDSSSSSSDDDSSSSSSDEDSESDDDDDAEGSDDDDSDGSSDAAGGGGGASRGVGQAKASKPAKTQKVYMYLCTSVYDSTYDRRSVSVSIVVCPCASCACACSCVLCCVPVCFVFVCLVCPSLSVVGKPISRAGWPMKIVACVHLFFVGLSCWFSQWCDRSET